MLLPLTPDVACVELEMILVRRFEAESLESPRRFIGTAAPLGVAIGALLAALAWLPAAAHATTIQYELFGLGPNQYRAVYSVANDGSLGAAIEGFDLFFDPALYLESSLSIVTPVPLATGWDEVLLGSGALVPAAYDALALSGGIPDSTMQAGFAVEFTWIGSGTPGAQLFEIFDPDTFEVLERGATTPIPEPSTFLMFSAGVAFFAKRLRARRS